MANGLTVTGSLQLNIENALSGEEAFYITTESLLEVVRGKLCFVMFCYW